MAPPSEPAPQRCSRCGAGFAADDPYCPSCGADPVTTRLPAPTTDVRYAGRSVRCAAYLMDVAVMIVPAFPLSIAGILLGVSAVITVVVPLAFLAVWLWLQICLALTGQSLGKSMLGLRLVNLDHRPPGFGPTVLRSLVFVATLGLAALPLPGLHDRVSGLRVIDVAAGANPLGPPTRAKLRRARP